MADTPQTLAPDLMTGIPEIAAFLGMPEKRVHRLAHLGQLPGVFRFGRLWQGRKSTLLRNIERLEAASEEAA